MLGKGIHITKRDMFYTDVKLFRDQADSDNVLDDVACMVGCTRSCLNVVESDKGLVVGRVTFLEDGEDVGLVVGVGDVVVAGGGEVQVLLLPLSLLSLFCIAPIEVAVDIVLDNAVHVVPVAHFALILFVMVDSAATGQTLFILDWGKVLPTMNTQ